MAENIISTWVYLDSEEEKSKYPNNSVKASSNSPEFQAIYWRCVIVFFQTSLRFHKNHRHILFTNTENIPLINGFSIKDFFEENNIEVISLKNQYPLPNGYFNSFRNQFFEFSILQEVSKFIDKDDNFLMLDSDCIFTTSIDKIFNELNTSKFTSITYSFDQNKANSNVNGLTGLQMKELFQDFGVQLNSFPFYSGGEVLLCKGDFIKKVMEDFPTLFKELMKRNAEGKIKFNEEAHVLSYFYYKYNGNIGGLNAHIKRMWTNHNYYRNIEKDDFKRAIWHLPNEKGQGFETMYNDIVNKKFEFDNQNMYLTYAKDTMLDPKNYKVDYYKRLKKNVLKIAKAVGLKN
ncbi:hypothetical protein [Maribacter hydrothermalis]|uniref:Nucleotide-diphospho-sugar transferase domain-containing protein n=1 Tax=Maribacter hydrothermalis TaxID=1836467 RepID=A0A1B7ZD62_9FLAO|nr:hypothetical protein [Maribacter hydrothermalis]APQ18507.1 hypothetical protein BTR34_14800 [Maribacter hydrothermalis]OBR41286.1 hypothetical protein A9200_13295 [Maribacter hydrothermalis]